MIINSEDAPFAYTISGGGSHGAWTIGALKFILNTGPDYMKNAKIFYGNSTGSLIVSKLSIALHTGDLSHFDELEDIYTNVTNQDILSLNQPDSLVLKHIIAPILFKLLGGPEDPKTQIASLVLSGKPSVYNVEPLNNLVDKHMSNDDWNIIIEMGTGSNPVEVGFCVVSMQTGSSQIISNISHPDAEILKKALIASTCEPFLMPQIDIFDDGDGWVDGGLRDFNPAKFVSRSEIKDQVKSILAISSGVLEDHHTNKTYDAPIDTLLRTIDILGSGVFDDDIEYMKVVTNKINKKFFSLSALEPFPTDGLIFDPIQMTKELEQGFFEAENTIRNF